MAAHESAADYAWHTSDAIRQTSEARARLGELVEAAREVVPTCWRCGSPDVYESERFVPRRPVCAACVLALITRALEPERVGAVWLAVDREGGRD